MANLFESLWRGAADSVKSPMRVVKDVSKGDFSKAFADLKHMPGNQERANQDILGSVGVRGWVGKHPGLSAAAVVGSIFGGAYAAGAYGAGATATGAGASTAGTTTAASGAGAGAGGAIGTSAATTTPTAASGAANATGASSGINWTQAINQLGSLMPQSGGQQQQQPQYAAPVATRSFQPVNLSGTISQVQPDYMNQINNLINGVR